MDINPTYLAFVCDRSSVAEWGMTPLERIRNNRASADRLTQTVSQLERKNDYENADAEADCLRLDRADINAIGELL